MYIKIIRHEIVYYILCVKDSKKDKWVERFISETLALTLIDNNICVLEK